MIEIKKMELDECSILSVTQFLQETFPKNKKFTESFVRWQYAQNPLGGMVAFNAWDEGKIVSHFAALPIDMNLWGERRKGLLCINVSTNINYRGKKLFTKLGEATIKYATESGYDFMMAVPNANSSHGFLKYFGFYLISSLTVKLGIGNNIYKQSDERPCYKYWDEEQWVWRLANPTNKYNYDLNGFVHTPIAYFVKSISKGRLTKEVAEKLQKSIGFRPVNLYIGLGADTSKGFYFSLPSFVKRPPFNLVFRDLTGKMPMVKKEDVFLQLIDLDTI